jgi:hypothetical protein
MPDQPKPQEREARFFLCTGQCVRYGDLHRYPNSHIMGSLTYVTDEGRTVTALARWDVSVSTVQVPPLKPVIDSLLIGDARGVRCRHPGCSNKQRWEIGKAAFLALMTRYGKETMDEVTGPTD